MQATRGVNRQPAGFSWPLPFVLAALVVITLLHYLTSAHLLPYHSIYRSLYYLPIAVAATIWGLRGGLLVSLLTSALYLPHVWLMGGALPGGSVDNVLEVLVFNFVAVLAGMLADAQRTLRLQAAALRTYIEDVLASLPVGVATTGSDGVPEPRNPTAIALLGDRTDREQIPVRPGYAELSLGGRPIGLRCSPLRDVAGTAAGHVLVLEDLSEQRRLHEQVRQAERLAALGRLAGGLAHEVRNPLAILRATAQLLAGKLAGRADLRRYTDVLTQEADRIDRLIQELLAYASPRCLEPAVFDLRPLVAELVDSLGPYAEKRGVRLEMRIEHSLPPLSADREQIRQALLNLLLNAVQATPARGTVAISSSASDTALCVEVRDAGAGIPPEIRGRVFDPFFTTRDEGTGMGLAVVARIIADHAGTIEVGDAPGGGALVSLCLPITAGPPRPAPEHDRRLDAHHEHGRQGG